MRSIGLVLISSLVLLGVSCGQKPALIGDIHVVRSSGEIRPGAGAEVLLIPAKADFVSKWEELVKEFRAAHQAALKDMVEESKIRGEISLRLQAERGRERLAALDQEYGSRRLKSSATLEDIGRWASDQKAAINEQGSAAQEALRLERDLELRRLADRDQESSLQAPGEIVRRYSSKAYLMVLGAHSNSSSSDQYGHFSVDGLDPGSYFLFSRVSFGDVSYHWFLPVDVFSGQTMLKLTSANAGWPFGPN